MGVLELSFGFSNYKLQRVYKGVNPFHITKTIRTVLNNFSKVHIVTTFTSIDYNVFDPSALYVTIAYNVFPTTIVTHQSALVI